MIGLLLALQVQGAWIVTPPTVTVGDTVWIIRRVTTRANVQARIEPLVDDDAILQLSDPRASFAEGILGIQYTVAAFLPGTLAVAMPDAELLFPDGRSEFVAGDTAWIVVTSVLTDSTATPRAVLGPIASTERRLWPLFLFVSVVGGSTVAWGVLRRRGPPMGQGVLDEEHEVPDPPVDRWIAAGEGRAAATYVTDRVRRALATLVPDVTRHLDTEAVVAVLERDRPDLLVSDIALLLSDLDRARFAPASSDAFVEVVDRSEALLQVLHATAAEGSP